MADDPEPTLARVSLVLCSLCLSGAGGECHIPGCALWMNRAPDVPLAVRHEALGRDVTIPERLRFDGMEIPIVIDPECEHEGVVYWNRDFQNRPTTPERIVLRVWSERVFLHEVIHCLIGDNEQLVRRLTMLHELGWRLA